MIAIALVLFVLGLVVGSFLNVLIYRTVQGEDFVKGRSRCDTCKKKIAWYDNIPLLSYVILGGKCRNCKKPISIQHPIIEFMSGILFVWWYAIGFAFFQLSQSPHTLVQPVFWLLVGILLLVIFVADWLYQIIPDYANFGLMLLAFLYRVYLVTTGAMEWRDFGLAIITGVGLMLFIWALWWGTKGRGMGFGDVKYALAMGILLGWPRALVGMFLAFVIGAVVGSMLILIRAKKFKERIAFGPFLVAATKKENEHFLKT